MDWFEKLTGFREAGYEETRARLEVTNGRLRSRVNGESYETGELELISLQTLQERAASGDNLPGRIRTSVVTGDVRRMHQSPENAGTLFQVASQFNLLEMVSPDVTPEHGVTRYQSDHTKVRLAPSRPAQRPSTEITSLRSRALRVRRRPGNSMGSRILVRL
jgi:hypothetical protein